MAATHTHTTDREVAVNHSFTITAVPASEAGALPGFRVSCTCGNAFTNAYEGNALAEAEAHQGWHARTGR
jgi:hypothetical protein